MAGGTGGFNQLSLLDFVQQWLEWWLAGTGWDVAITNVTAGIAAVNLARILHLDSRVELVPQDTGLTRLTLIESGAAADALVEMALRSRPELKQSQALISAARQSQKGAVYGPLIPSLGAQIFGGGLGGGPDSGPSNLGAEGK